MAIGGSVRELHVLRPDRVRIVPGSDGWPEAWDYTVAGRTVRLGADVVPGIRSVLHMKLFHPTNDHYGMSPLEAAATSIDIHNAAARWNKALLDNSARPSGALVYASREGNLTSEQYERLKHELERGFQGAANAGRPLLLEGGLDWKSMSLSPKDLDFIEAKNSAAREIALALGVPRHRGRPRKDCCWSQSSASGRPNCCEAAHHLRPKLARARISCCTGRHAENR